MKIILTPEICVGIYVFISYFINAIWVRKYLKTEYDFRHNKEGKEIRTTKRMGDYGEYEVKYEKIVIEAYIYMFLSPFCVLVFPFIGAYFLIVGILGLFFVGIPTGQRLKND